MPALPIPLKKLRRNAKFAASLLLLVVVLWAAYLQFLAAPDDWGDDFQVRLWNEVYPAYRHALERKALHVDVPKEEDQVWAAGHQMQPWKPEYRGRANLHVFEDWCGSSTDQLRKNIHYPLYPHSRVMVKKLAVSPMWTNYGLRIFGYLHPYSDDEYLFAVASEDNSEFWLSSDASPLNLQLLVYVGKTGKEWTAPGEFGKYASQTSDPVLLSAKKRYFFEVIHKQNDKGTDHVEIAWRLNRLGTSFTIIKSEHISLYIDETLLKMNDVEHIPQSVASHTSPPGPPSSVVDMLRDDPRDSFYKVPLINEAYVRHILPDCSYKPSYIIKGFPLLRYQGLQFVYLSSIYPNDYTRLTHMETDNKCFYRENPQYLKRYGFFNYMKMDSPEDGFANYDRRIWNKQGYFRGREPPDEGDLFQYEVEDEEPWRKVKRQPDDGDDFDNRAFGRKRKLLSVSPDSTPVSQGKPDSRLQEVTRRPTKTQKRMRSSRQGQPTYAVTEASFQKIAAPAAKEGRLKRQLIAEAALENKTFYSNVTETKSSRGNLKRSLSRRKLPSPEPKMGADGHHQTSHRKGRRRKDDVKESPKLNMDNNVQSHLDSPATQRVTNGLKQTSTTGVTPTDPDENEQFVPQDISEFEEEDDNYKMDNPVIFDPVVNWNQTFDVNPVDLQVLRSNEIDLQCNVSGNLLLRPSEALAVVEVFMRNLNQKNSRPFSLLRVVNVERRLDGSRGSRYLLELELVDHNGTRLRLSRYVYMLRRQPRLHVMEGFSRVEPLLCNPQGLTWRPSATVHFIVPVKNQARWVQQFISDMEALYRITNDNNFNIIITDFSSTDMNVELALKKSALPRHQYLRLDGNFERSAGLQAGIDLIADRSSIVFLCDLHIHFPPSIIDTIRKHCVEGKMAFAPIVMRLNCGATPQEPNGFWEVNGFGLLGIYKSDLDAVGGMNTEDFRDRWGGEDWELLDRIFQTGLEVERIYLRNFMHHFHSRRGMWNRQSMRSV